MARRDLVVIGTSAGGVSALLELLGALPGDLPAALALVIHLAAHERSYLQGTLQGRTELRVRTAADGMAIEPGVVIVPVPDRHVLVTSGGVRLTRGPRECRARPSIDALFRSAALAYGPRAIGVVLTGMLDDGTAGLWAIKDRGGIALVLDPGVAEHRAMPASAIQAVDVDFIGDLDGIAREIVRLAGSVVEERALPPSEPLATGNRIARGVEGREAGSQEIGPASPFTCPACHGGLAQLGEGRGVTRFCCHTGHAFSMRTLLAEIDEAVDDGLWSSVRTIHERIRLLRQMGQVALDSGRPDLAAGCHARADDAERRLRPIETLLLEGDPSDADLDAA
jgi:two-component system chemotaxis response regulator CheB